MKYDVAYTIDQQYQIPFCCSLSSLLDHNKTDINRIFVVQSSHASNSEKFWIIKNHIETKYQKEVLEVILDDSSYAKFNFSGHVTAVAYFIFSIADYLPNDVSKLLYLDPDTIVTSNLKMLAESTFGEEYLMAIDHNVNDLSRFSNICSDIKSYFNGGVLFINLSKWRDDNLSDKFWAIANNRPKELKFWNQDILNIVLHNRWRELPYSYNSYGLNKKLTETPKIIHYTGNRKPWNFFCNHPYKNEFWEVLNKTPFKKDLLLQQLLGGLFTIIVLPLATLRLKYFTSPKDHLVE